MPMTDSTTVRTGGNTSHVQTSGSTSTNHTTETAATRLRRLGQPPEVALHAHPDVVVGAYDAHTRRLDVLHRHVDEHVVKPVLRFLLGLAAIATAGMLGGFALLR